MSIHQTLQKVNIFSWIYILIFFICTSIIAFVSGYFLGQKPPLPIEIIMPEPVPALEILKDKAVHASIPQEFKVLENVPSAKASVVGETQFVASKSGTKYYTQNCPGLNRIKPENRVFFITEEQAQAKGLERASGCQW